jgi:hypothetical protein
MNGSTEKIADAATAVTWAGWFGSHLTETNEMLRFFVLLVALITGLFSLAIHYRRWVRQA